MLTEQEAIAIILGVAMLPQLRSIPYRDAQAPAIPIDQYSYHGGF